MSSMPPAAIQSFGFHYSGGSLEEAKQLLQESISGLVAELGPFLGHVKGAARGEEVLFYASSTGGAVTVTDLSPTERCPADVEIEVTALVLSLPTEQLAEAVRRASARLNGRVQVKDLSRPHHHEHHVHKHPEP